MQTDYLIAFALIFTIDSISPGPAVATVITKGSTIGLAPAVPGQLAPGIADRRVETARSRALR